MSHRILDRVGDGARQVVRPHSRHRVLRAVMAKWLASDPATPRALPMRWGNRKFSRKTYRAMCDVPLDISKGELERHLEVFGGNHFGMTPKIRLHGVEFRAVTPLTIDEQRLAAGGGGT